MAALIPTQPHLAIAATKKANGSHAERVARMPSQVRFWTYWKYVLKWILLVDDIDWEITDEDEEAYDDCDGTETGEMKEFCESGQGKRVRI
jgi:hypothetical protein